MDASKIADRIAKELTAADPKVTVTKTAKVRLAAGSAEEAVKKAQNGLRDIERQLNAWLSSFKLGGWIAKVEIGEGSSKLVEEPNRYLVAVKVRAEVKFSHTSRVNDAISIIIDKVSKGMSF